MGLSPTAARRKLLSPRPRKSMSAHLLSPQHLIPFFLLLSFVAFVWVVSVVSPHGRNTPRPSPEQPLSKADVDAAGLLARDRVVKSEREWRELLTSAEFEVLRRRGTEPKFSSPLLREKRPGAYRCKACGNPLFSSGHKYDSGTGWPSFKDVLPGAVDETLEASAVLGMSRRTEVTCSKCGAHLGHVFDDGPTPTHKRYCMNGIALQFSPNQTLTLR